MEKNLLHAPETDEHIVYAELAELVLNNALVEFRKEQIRIEIDRALDNGNKEAFFRLTEELKRIC